MNEKMSEWERDRNKKVSCKKPHKWQLNEQWTNKRENKTFFYRNAHFSSLLFVSMSVDLFKYHTYWETAEWNNMVVRSILKFHTGTTTTVKAAMARVNKWHFFIVFHKSLLSTLFFIFLIAATAAFFHFFILLYDCPVEAEKNTQQLNWTLSSIHILWYYSDVCMLMLLKEEIYVFWGF